MITIYHDNPRITERSKVRQSACITIKEDTKLDDEVSLLTIQKGKYAVGHFEITAAMFPKAWEDVIVWVKTNGYKLGDRDYFEVYLNDSRTHPEQKFLVDICVPVE
ncbi:AraC family transcriptional regulator [Chitinophaga defluvii]|uniref:GyrI-like domain-containing protein n=1 Tax=Chitinophaga defluvii TaxID=3163343 RepID=A0ABV2T2V7_9BACT